MEFNAERIKKVMESGILLSHYSIVLGLTAPWEIEELEDPVQDFKERVLLLNKEGQLPEMLSEYCDRYRVAYNKPEIGISGPWLDL